MPLSDKNAHNSPVNSAQLAKEALALYREQQSMSSVIANRAIRMRNSTLSDLSWSEASTTLHASVSYIESSLRQSQIKDDYFLHQLNNLKSSRR